MTPSQVLLVGSGPAGAALAYLLTRRGVRVTLLEKHLDFERSFRGEGLQPSGLDALLQMGLREQFDRLPQTRLDVIELWRRDRRLARIQGQALGFVAHFISQPATLTMLTTEAGRFPNFQIEMGVTVRELLHKGSRVAGVRADTPQGTREFFADLVVGTDGRHSVVRKQGGFEELRIRQSFDFIWFKVPFPKFWPDHHTARLILGTGYLTGGIPTSDGQLLTGFTIPKGSFAELRSHGADAWAQTIVGHLPADLAQHVRAHVEVMKQTVLLDVIVGRLSEWTAPGLLLLGDAAHPMSPVGGQGLNVALRDALVAANHLCPVLTGNAEHATLDAATRRVAEERLPEIVTLQQHQARQARLFLDPGLVSRCAIRLLPLLVRSGLVKRLLGKRLEAFQHGVVPVRLTV
jgi:2-polyprenyl-6-methoxyphenol hydroxylase-like FAD-dependent oxidoreductase